MMKLTCAWVSIVFAGGLLLYSAEFHYTLAAATLAIVGMWILAEYYIPRP